MMLIIKLLNFGNQFRIKTSDKYDKFLNRLHNITIKIYF